MLISVHYDVHRAFNEAVFWFHRYSIYFINYCYWLGIWRSNGEIWNGKTWKSYSGLQQYYTTHITSDIFTSIDLWKCFQFRLAYFQSWAWINSHFSWPYASRRYIPLSFDDDLHLRVHWKVHLGSKSDVRLYHFCNRSSCSRRSPERARCFQKTCDYDWRRKFDERWYSNGCIPCSHWYCPGSTI